MNLSELARIVFQTELENMQLNLTGCIEGMDSDHLHDLRVAERRTRAALNEFKDLLPEPVRLQYLEEFRWLHQITNQVRDLDVGLSHFPYYRRKVPLYRRGKLRPAQKLLESRRREEQHRLAEVLRSGRVENLLQTWSSQLNSGILFTNPAGLLPAAEYGCDRVSSRYSKLLKKGSDLTLDSPSRDFHKLRINVKKLRYQIEFYSRVLNQRRISRLIRGLKRFQDCLGSHQDAVVQVEHIQRLARELPNAGIGADTQGALDHLIASYQNQITSSKKKSLRRVRWLISPRTIQKFQRCFQYPVD